MDSSKDIIPNLPAQFDELLEAMAEMERRGETKRVEEMRVMLDRAASMTPRSAARPGESRRDRRARERREAKAERKARYTPDPRFDEPAFRARILSHQTEV
jgi:hypothetical protein